MSSSEEIQKVFDELIEEVASDPGKEPPASERASVALALIGGLSLLKGQMGGLQKEHDVFLVILEGLCESLGIDLELLKPLYLFPESEDLSREEIWKAEDKVIKVLVSIIQGEDNNADTQ